MQISAGTLQHVDDASEQRVKLSLITKFGVGHLLRTKTGLVADWAFLVVMFG